MSTRVTAAEVSAIIDTDVSDLTPFITVANLLVNKLLSEDSSLSTDQLKEIERWLAAHFVAIRDPVVRAETTEGTKVEYWLGTVDGASNLMMTPYGQMACALDTTGRLRSAGKKRAEFNAIDLDL